jgi:hypothetical protein
MKNYNLISGKKIQFVICVLLITTQQIFSQSIIIQQLSAINFAFAVPIVFVIALAVFLFTSFIKQKNN